MVWPQEAETIPRCYAQVCINPGAQHPSNINPHRLELDRLFQRGANDYATSEKGAY